MEYRPLGRAGVKVSPLCLGALECSVSDDLLKKVDEVVPPGTDTF